MPNFLQLCQQLREEVGVAGVISTTVGQTGMLLRLINYVVKADRDIQRKKNNWKFLWGHWSQLLNNLSVTADYGDSPLIVPDTIARFDEDSFWIDAGTTDAYQLEFVQYEAFKDLYRNYLTDPSSPAIVTITPDSKVVIYPVPAGNTSVLTAEYWKKPIPLANDNQVSAIPETYHDIIVARAKMYYADKAHDYVMSSNALDEFKTLYLELRTNSLPGWEDDGKSQSSSQHVIEIL